MFYRAAAGDLRAFDASELVELLRELGSEQAELDELTRLVKEAPMPEERLENLREPVRIIFVGGAEPQEQARPQVTASLAERYYGMVEVDWFIPGWSSNWPLVAEKVESAYDHPGAVVLMVLVRTNFGRWTRRTAGEHGLPWVSCTGHGRASMERAIDCAVTLARDRVSAGAGEN